MTNHSELSEMMAEAFRTALLLTASEALAESAVLDAIEALDRDGVSSDCLQRETVASAIRKPAAVAEEIDQASSTLPAELARVLLLERRQRHSFVLRVLVGLDRQTCSGILQLSIPQIDEAVSQALQQLAWMSSPAGTPAKSYPSVSKFTFVPAIGEMTGSSVLWQMEYEHGY